MKRSELPRCEVGDCNLIAVKTVKDAEGGDMELCERHYYEFKKSLGVME